MIRKTLTIALAFAITTLTACGDDTGAGAPQGPTDTGPHGQDAGAGSFVSTDGRVKIKCPQGWALAEQNKQADIELTNAKDDTHLWVMTQPRSSFTGDLARFSEKTRGMVVADLADVDQQGPTELTINGHRAIQYKLTATYNRTRIAYLHTVVQTETSLQQALTWTVASKFDTFEPMFQWIIATLEEVDAGQ